MDIAQLDRARWRIESPLAEGGQAILFRVVEEHGRRQGVLKMLHRALASSARAVRWMRNEADVLQRLQGNAGIPDLYDYGLVDGGVPCLVMETLEGPTLHEVLEQRPHGLEERQLASLFRQAVSVLQCVHAAQVLHRDLSPRNLVWLRTGRVGVLDFGISLWLPKEDPEARRFPVGTRPYLAPEVLKGQWSFRSDIYALGAVMYELATGRKIYEASDDEDLDRLISSYAPTPLIALRPTLSSWLSRVVMKCLAGRSDQRYGCMQELALALYPQAGVDRRHCPVCGTPFTGRYCNQCGFERGSAALVVVDGPHARRVLRLWRRWVIGRREINPGDLTVSNKHLCLERRNAHEYAVEGVGRNGTLLNGQPLYSSSILYAGDELVCGRTRLKFVA